MSDDITLLQAEIIRDRAQHRLDDYYREIGSRHQPPKITFAIVRFILEEAASIATTAAPDEGGGE